MESENCDGCIFKLNEFKKKPCDECVGTVSFYLDAEGIKNTYWDNSIRQCISCYFECISEKAFPCNCCGFCPDDESKKYYLSYAGNEVKIIYVDQVNHVTFEWVEPEEDKNIKDEKEECEVCRFYGTKSALNSSRMPCQFNPPRVFKNKEGMPYNVWPQMLPSEWCGEFDKKD